MSDEESESVYLRDHSTAVLTCQVCFAAVPWTGVAMDGHVEWHRQRGEAPQGR